MTKRGIKLPGIGQAMAYEMEQESGAKLQAIAVVPVSRIGDVLGDQIPAEVWIRMSDEVTATIETAASRSEELDGSLYAGMIVHTPIVMAANRYIGIAVYDPARGDFDLLYNGATGTPVVAMTTTVGRSYTFPAEFFPAKKFKLVLMTNASVETAAAAQLLFGITFKA